MNIKLIVRFLLFQKLKYPVWFWKLERKKKKKEPHEFVQFACKYI